VVFSLWDPYESVVEQQTKDGDAYLEEVLDAVGNARHFDDICVGDWGGLE
jgi:hypothetical protein